MVYNYIVQWKKRYGDKQSEISIREMTRTLTMMNLIHVDYSKGIDQSFVI